MDYREHAPLPALAHLVELIWTLDGHADLLGEEAQPVFPDGRCELILHLGDPFDRIHETGAVERQAMVLFAGQLTSRLVLRPTGRIAIVGVRFHPYGAAAAVAPPQRELAGLTTDVGSVDARLGRSLREVQDQASSTADAVTRVQAVLLRQCATASPDPRVRHVVTEIERRHGQVSIDRLAHATGLTRRHLERQFLRQVGVPPKRLARIARFQRALRLLDETDEASRRGAVTAADCGYADQAHFVRDFRDLAGCAPGAHLLQRGALTEFFTRDC